MADAARDTLARAGVRTPISDEDLAEIAERASAASSGSSSVGSQRSTNSETPFSHSSSSSSVGSATSPGGETSSYYYGSSTQDLSLPGDLLSELGSSRFAAGGMSSRIFVGGMNAASTTRTSVGNNNGLPVVHPPTSAVVQEYEARIEALTQQLHSTTQAARLTELDFQRREREALDAAARAKDEAVAAKAAVHAAETAQLMTEKEYKQKLDAAKSMFADIRVSTALYEELQQMSPDSLSLREFVQLRTADAVVPLQQALETARRHAEDAHQQSTKAQQEREKDRRTLTQEVSIALARETAAKESQTLAETQSNRLQTKLQEAMATIESLHGKGSAYDALFTRVKELEASALKDTSNIASLQGAVENYKIEKQEAMEKVAKSQHRIETLVSERASLAAAVDDLRLHCRSLEDSVSRLTEQVRDTERLKNEAKDTLQRMLENGGKTPAEEKVDAEVRRMREERHLEMETLRVEVREMYEREIASLRSARTDAVTELARLRDRFETLTSAHQELIRSTSERIAAAEKLASNAVAEARIKTSESDQAIVAHAEDADALRNARLEIDVLREKLFVVQSECARLEGAAEKAKASLEAYTHLEHTVDAAVMAAAAAASAEGDHYDDENGNNYNNNNNSNTTEYEEDADHERSTTYTKASSSSPRQGNMTTNNNSNNYNNSGKDILQKLGISASPSAARRMEQAIALGKELLACKRENETLAARNDSLSKLLEHAQKDSLHVRSQLDAIEGPQEYFIELLREKEIQVKNLRSELGEAKTSGSSLRKAVTGLQATKERLEGEITILRDKMAAADHTVMNLRTLLDDVKQQNFMLVKSTSATTAAAAMSNASSSVMMSTNRSDVHLTRVGGGGADRNNGTGMGMYSSPTKQQQQQQYQYQHPPPGGVPVSPGPAVHHFANNIGTSWKGMLEGGGARGSAAAAATGANSIPTLPGASSFSPSASSSPRSSAMQANGRPSSEQHRRSRRGSVTFSSEIPVQGGILLQFDATGMPIREPTPGNNNNNNNNGMSPAKAWRTTSFVNVAANAPGYAELQQQQSPRTFGVSSVDNILPGGEPSHSSSAGGVGGAWLFPSLGDAAPDVTVRPLMLVAGATALPKWYKRTQRGGANAGQVMGGM